MLLKNECIYTVTVPVPGQPQPPVTVVFRRQDTLPDDQWSIEAPGYFRVVPRGNALEVFQQLWQNGCRIVECDRVAFEEAMGAHE